MEAVIVTIAVAALGGTAIRILRQVDSLHDKVDTNTGRLERIDGRLGNGLANEIRQMREVDADVRGLKTVFERFVKEDFDPFRANVEDHIANEESRILDFCNRHHKGEG